MWITKERWSAGPSEGDAGGDVGSDRAAAVAGGMIGGGVGAVVGAGIGAGVSTVMWLKQDRQAELPKDVGLVFSLIDADDFDSVECGSLRRWPVGLLIRRRLRFK